MSKKNHRDNVKSAIAYMDPALEQEKWDRKDKECLTGLAKMIGDAFPTDNSIDRNVE